MISQALRYWYDHREERLAYAHAWEKRNRARRNEYKRHWRKRMTAAQREKARACTRRYYRRHRLAILAGKKKTPRPQSGRG